ncbi:hypothetical protein 1 [Gerbera anandria sobemo-like virus]|nr:hypothetical protein 1 [Gerbera anandria sobemo-like virus]
MENKLHVFYSGIMTVVAIYLVMRDIDYEKANSWLVSRLVSAHDMTISTREIIRNRTSGYFERLLDPTDDTSMLVFGLMLLGVWTVCSWIYRLGAAIIPPCVDRLMSKVYELEKCLRALNDAPAYSGVQPEAYKQGSEVTAITEYPKGIVAIVKDGSILGMGMRVRGFLVTATHVVENAVIGRELKGRTSKDENDLFPLTLSTFNKTVAVDPDYWMKLEIEDVILIRVPDKVWSAVGVKEASIAVMPDGKKQPAMAYGPYGKTRGTVSRDYETVEYTGTTLKGFSGGPYVVADRIVGIHQTGSKEVPNQGVYMAFVKAFIDKVVVTEDSVDYLIRLAMRSKKKGRKVRATVYGNNFDLMVEDDVTGAQVLTSWEELETLKIADQYEVVNFGKRAGQFENADEDFQRVPVQESTGKEKKRLPSFVETSQGPSNMSKNSVTESRIYVGGKKKPEKEFVETSQGPPNMSKNSVTESRTYVGGKKKPEKEKEKKLLDTSGLTQKPAGTGQKEQKLLTQPALGFCSEQEKKRILEIIRVLDSETLSKLLELKSNL